MTGLLLPPPPPAPSMPTQTLGRPPSDHQMADEPTLALCRILAWDGPAEEASPATTAPEERNGVPCRWDAAGSLLDAPYAMDRAVITHKVPGTRCPTCALAGKEMWLLYATPRRTPVTDSVGNSLVRELDEQFMNISRPNRVWDALASSAEEMTDT
ncbi:hypothetical protein G7Z17_g9584 [Cylindrodendrum hubeiense]|uniref:Uncharacterized protein n=1 Tax=Cylindrodendrum hubeiense TaxID=595255 RepID=A0A9P5L5J1_9HYPO|nr:hypothetical protein G7Z17_g9584 [Cylindrodendrum hubeiense]